MRPFKSDNFLPLRSPTRKRETHRMLLRPRLNCHYCGGRSSFRQKRGTKFTCQHCQAVNFLDENGEIADVPPDEILEAESRALPADSTSATTAFHGDSYFCSTCVKNQLLYNNALAEYLPEPSDPRYDQFEANLPTYKLELEDRYPQVCRQCEPRVRQKLQQAVYTAKADHVRRLLDRSRAKRVSYGWGWRRLVVWFAGTGTGVSVVGQLLWHAMGATTDPKLELRQYRSPICLLYFAKLTAVPTKCGSDYSTLAGYSFALGTICVWWNPKWAHKIAGREGRLVGLSKFYKVQAGLLVLRFLSWLWLRELDPAETYGNLQKPLHGILLVLWIVVTSWSMYAIIKVDKTPLVNWHQDPAPLLSQTQFIPPASQQQYMVSPPDSQIRSTTPQQFPIGTLSSNRGSEYAPWRPPTPPDDTEAMEWEPLRVKEYFNPKPRPLHKQRNEPSPFYGRLPALGDPKRLQYPDVPPPAEGVGIPPGFFERPQTTWTGPTRPEMAEAKFKPHLRQDPDTGLENIFGKVFSLNDDMSSPAGARRPESQNLSSEYQAPHEFNPATEVMDYEELDTPQRWTATATLAAVSTCALILAILIWFLSDLLPAFSDYIKFWTIGLVACIPLLHLLLSTPHVLRSSESFYCIVELGILALLGVERLWYICPSGGTCDKMTLGMMGFLLWHEFYMIWTSDTPMASNAATLMNEPAIQSPFAYQSNMDQAAPTEAQQPAVDQDPMDITFQPSTTSQLTDHSLATYSARSRSPSINSTVSNLSTSTTSTSAAWGHTPKRPSSTRSTTFGMHNLSMDAFSSGTNVVGPRRRADGSSRAGFGGAGARGLR